MRTDGQHASLVQLGLPKVLAFELAALPPPSQMEIVDSQTLGAALSAATTLHSLLSLAAADSDSSLHRLIIYQLNSIPSTMTIIRGLVVYNISSVTSLVSKIIPLLRLKLGSTTASCAYSPDLDALIVPYNWLCDRTNYHYLSK
jgi:hypothetical protein